MKKTFLFGAVIAIAITPGCNTTELPEEGFEIDPKLEQSNTQDSIQSEIDPSNSQSEYDLKILPDPDYISTISFEGNESEINDGINKFSIDLFKTISHNYSAVYSDESGSNNISVSPLSVAFCLGLMSNAIDDASCAKIMDLLGATDITEFNNYCHKLMRYLPYGSESDCKLKLANSAWLSDAYDFNDSFTSELNAYYYAEVYSENFADDKTQNLIDFWCSVKTNGTIHKSPIQIDSTCSFLLLNSVYFNAEWAYRFNADNTHEDTFFGLTSNAKIDMMHRNLYAKYLKADNYAALRLGYNFNDFEMVIILPDNGINIESFSESLTYEEYVKAAQASKTYDVNLYLPKFNIKQDANLENILSMLGMPTSNIKFTNAGINQVINPVIKQSTYADVDEGGSSVAAVTGIGSYISDLDQGQTPSYEKVNMTVNRPFIYFVRNTKTGSIIMAGRVCNL